MAREDGKPLVYELFYVDELPPRLRSPFDPAATKPACTTLVFQAAPPKEDG